MKTRPNHMVFIEQCKILFYFDTFGLVTMNCNFQIFGDKHGLYILVYLCQNLDL